jgi:hypothetical protein
MAMIKTIITRLLIWDFEERTVIWCQLLFCAGFLNLGVLFSVSCLYVPSINGLISEKALEKLPMNQPVTFSVNPSLSLSLSTAFNNVTEHWRS